MTSGQKYALTKIYPRVYTDVALDSNQQFWPNKAPIFEVVGVAARTANLSVTLGTLGLSSVGTVIVAGNESSTLGALLLAAADTEAVLGNLSSTLGVLTLASAGTLPIVANESSTLGTLSLASADTEAVLGNLSSTLGLLSLGSSGTLPIAANLNVTLGTLLLSSADTEAVLGNLSETLGTLGLNAAGQVVPDLAAVIDGNSSVDASLEVRQSLAADILGQGDLTLYLVVTGGDVVPIVPTGGGVGHYISFPYRKPLEKRPRLREARITRKWLFANIKGGADVTPSLRIRISVTPHLRASVEGRRSWVKLQPIIRLPLRVKSKAKARVKVNAPRLQDSFYFENESDLQDALHAILML